MMHLRQILWLGGLAVFTLAGSYAAQRGAGPDLAACGQHDGFEVICGTNAPEDFELTPGNERILVAQFGRGAATGPALSLFDPETGTFEDAEVRSEPSAGWGAPGCAEPDGLRMRPHGLSLAGRLDGATALYVVNHEGRESIEMFEVSGGGADWELIWRGCFESEIDYNDLAILPNGGFVGTRPSALQEPGGNAFGGPSSGNVAMWTADGGEAVLPGTESGFPNGVAVDTDGRYAYIAAWTGRQAIKYDLEARERVVAVDLDFMPDNLTWTDQGTLLAAGILGLGGNLAGFEVAEIDPETMEVRTVYRSEGDPTPIGGVSVAIKRGDDVFVGSFQGDRVVRVDWTEN
jgi:hypothetical protein